MREYSGAHPIAFAGKSGAEYRAHAQADPRVTKSMETLKSMTANTQAQDAPLRELVSRFAAVLNTENNVKSLQVTSSTWR